MRPRPYTILRRGATISFGAAMFVPVRIQIKGRTGLLIAAAIITALLVAFPAYHVIFVISVAIGIIAGIGVIVAALLHLRNKYRPIREEEVQTKRPLGLD